TLRCSRLRALRLPLRLPFLLSFPVVLPRPPVQFLQRPGHGSRLHPSFLRGSSPPKEVRLGSRSRWARSYPAHHKFRGRSKSGTLPPFQWGCGRACRRRSRLPCASRAATWPTAHPAPRRSRRRCSTFRGRLSITLSSSSSSSSSSSRPFPRAPLSPPHSVHPPPYPRSTIAHTRRT